MLGGVEIPAHDRVRNLGRSPERQEQVVASNPVEVVSSRLPTLVVVGFGSVVKISHVLDPHAAAVKRCARRAGYIGSPIARIARRSRRPPECDDNHWK